MPDFNQHRLDSRIADDRKITDPKNVGANPLYPKHLFLAAEAEDEGAHVIAWHGKTPIYNTFIDVQNVEEEEEKLEEEYSLVPVVPERPKAPKAAKPAAKSAAKPDAPAAPKAPKAAKPAASAPKGQ